jgi:predicted XRE-type DNA-binding protein
MAEGQGNMKTLHEMGRKHGARLAVTRGSGNVFADLGFTAGEAAELEVKAELTRQIRNGIRALRLTQVQAAGRLRLSQPDVSKLMCGRYSGYSVDRLFGILNALDVDVDIVLRPRREHGRNAPGVVRVMPLTEGGKRRQRLVRTA